MAGMGEAGTDEARRSLPNSRQAHLSVSDRLQCSPTSPNTCENHRISKRRDNFPAMWFGLQGESIFIHLPIRADSWWRVRHVDGGGASFPDRELSLGSFSFESSADVGG